MKWRAYLRLTAMLINGVFVLSLIGTKAWFMPLGGLGMPLLVPPLIALIALITSHYQRGLSANENHGDRHQHAGI